MMLSLDGKRLRYTFILCAICLVIFPAIIPQLRLTYFAPFLIIACYQKSLKACLWLALGVGVLLDLLSSQTRLGLYAFDYCLTIALLYPQRRNFFADSITTLPIMVFLFAFLSTVIMAILLYSVETRNVFSWPWVFTDLICMPLLDALYAFVLFTLPSTIFGRTPRRGKDYFF